MTKRGQLLQAGRQGRQIDAKGRVKNNGTGALGHSQGGGLFLRVKEMVVHHVVARKLAAGEKLAEAAVNVQQDAAKALGVGLRVSKLLVDAGRANANDIAHVEL